MFRPRHLLIIPSAALATAALACQLASGLPSSGRVTPSHEPSTPARPPTSTITPSAAPPPSATPPALTPTPRAQETRKPLQATAIPSRPLSDQGPWWVLTNPEGIAALNPDGSGFTQLANLPPRGGLLILPGRQAAPSGGMLAVMEIPGGDPYAPPTLSLLSLPQGSLEPVAQLVSSSIDYASLEGQALQDALDLWAAVAIDNKVAWSSDGRLAFSAALHGPSADLYTFSPAEGQITRLTSGKTQAVDPVWSPDDRFIVHGAVKRSQYAAGPGEPYGHQYVALWAARADGSGSIKLLDTDITGFQRVIDWVSDTEFLTDAFTDDPLTCPYQSLMRVNILDASLEVLWEGRYSARAFDPVSRTLLIAYRDHPVCESGLPSGLYLLELGSSAAPRLIAEGEFADLKWDPNARLFFAAHSPGGLRWDGMLAIPLSLTPIPVPMPDGAAGFPFVSSDGAWLAWVGDRLWIAPMDPDGPQTPQEVYGDWTDVAAWSGDGATLLFSPIDGLFIAAPPYFIPHMVDNLIAGDFSWVEP